MNSIAVLFYEHLPYSGSLREILAVKVTFILQHAFAANRYKAILQFELSCVNTLIRKSKVGYIIKFYAFYGANLGTTKYYTITTKRNG